MTKTETWEESLYRDLYFVSSALRINVNFQDHEHWKDHYDRHRMYHIAISLTLDLRSWIGNYT